MKLLEHQSRDSMIKTDQMDSEFLPEIAPVVACIGEDLCRSEYQGEFYQPQSIHHLNLSVYIALRAINYMAAVPKIYTSWGGKVDIYVDEHGNRPTGKDAEELDDSWRLCWLKTLFRCVLCMPLGYMVAHTVLRSESKSSPPWQPNMMDLPEYSRRWGPPQVNKTDFWISPRGVSFDTYRRLYDPLDRSIPMLAAAEADFFADRPNRQNPLWRAYRRALNHVTAKRESYPYPYWWAFAINHERMLDPDFEPIRINVRRREEFSFAPAANSSETEEQPSNESPGDTAEEKTDQVPPSTADANPILTRALDYARRQVDRGEFKSNCAGAVFQGHGGDTHIVVPLFFIKLGSAFNQPDLTAEHLHQLFVDAHLLQGNSLNTPEVLFEIKPEGMRKRLGKCRALKLSDTGKQALFPNGVPFSDNPDLVPLVLTKSASAA